MTSDELRDTLAIEMAKIILSKQVGASNLENTLEVMTYVYPLADAVLSRRNTHTPVIAKCEFEIKRGMTVIDSDGTEFTLKTGPVSRQE